MSVYVPHLPKAHQVQKRVSFSLELGLWMVVSHCVCVGNQTGSSARATNALSAESSSPKASFFC